MGLPFALGLHAPTLWELLIILAVALLIFGRRLPEIARSLGRGIVEFKKGLKGIEDDADHAGDAPPPRPRAQVTPPPAPPKQLAPPAPEIPAQAGSPSPPRSRRSPKAS